MLFSISLLGLSLQGENVHAKPVLRLACLSCVFPDGPWDKVSLETRGTQEFDKMGLEVNLTRWQFINIFGLESKCSLM